MMAALYDVSISAVSQHLKKVYDDHELEREATIVIQLEKRLAVLKLRLRFPFHSPANAGSLHSQRSLRAPRGSTLSS